jgi:two-component system response regulator AtoC
MPRLDAYPFSCPRLLALWQGGFASVPLPRTGQILVGRGLSADLRVGAPSVSREHLLVVAGDPACLIDSDSANGVHVDGVRAAPGEPVPFEPGNVVELGDAFLLIEHSLSVAEVSPPSQRSQRPTQIDALENAVERVRRLEPAGARLQRLADTIASTSLGVLVVGEPGSGRATLAKRLHRRSPRAERSFLSIECRALAGSGGKTSLSLLSDVHGGTVLLENVSELPLETQAHLMDVVGPARLLVDRQAARRLDVRLVATSSRDLRELVAEGSFRLDLYLRLCGVHLTLPSLRERGPEIVPLARQFLVEASARAGLPVPELAPEARAWLKRHDWPGNLLELRRVMERALSRSQAETIELGHLQRARDFAPQSGVRTIETAFTLQGVLPEPERPTNPFATAELEDSR